MMTEYHKYQHIQEQIEREQAAKKVPPDADEDIGHHTGSYWGTQTKRSPNLTPLDSWKYRK